MCSSTGVPGSSQFLFWTERILVKPTGLPHVETHLCVETHKKGNTPDHKPPQHEHKVRTVQNNILSLEQMFLSTGPNVTCLGGATKHETQCPLPSQTTLCWGHLERKLKRYCGWTKSCTTWKPWDTSGAGFRPSTVSTTNCFWHVFVAGVESCQQAAGVSFCRFPPANMGVCVCVFFSGTPPR